MRMALKPPDANTIGMTPAMLIFRGRKWRCPECLLAYQREYAARKINVRYRLSGEAVEYEIEDQGTGFDHQTQLARRPAATESHGRGIHIARNFFDRVEYNDKGNCVKLRKALASRRI